MLWWEKMWASLNGAWNKWSLASWETLFKHIFTLTTLGKIGIYIEALFVLLIVFFLCIQWMGLMYMVPFHFSTCLHNAVYEGSVKYSSYSLLCNAIYWPFHNYSGSECTILPFKSPTNSWKKIFCYMVLVSLF